MKLSRKHIKFLLLGISFVALSCFAVFSALVNNGYFLEVDQFINANLHSRPGSLWFWYSKILEYLYVLLVLLCGRMFYKFYRRGERLEALLLGMTAFFSVFAQFFLKPVFNILCPGSYYNSVFSTYKLIANSRIFQRIALEETCYPSNHTVGYIVTCGYLALLLKTYYSKRRETNILVLILITIALTVGYTRIYLHVHWFSDVIAAYFLGAALLCLIFWTRLHRREFKDFLKVVYEKLEKYTKRQRAA